MAKKKLPVKIQDELDNCGLPFEVIIGKMHAKIFICNRLCGIMPSTLRSSHWRAELNVRSQIRKMVKEIKEGKRA